MLPEVVSVAELGVADVANKAIGFGSLYQIEMQSPDSRGPIIDRQNGDVVRKVQQGKRTRGNRHSDKANAVRPGIVELCSKDCKVYVFAQRLQEC
jgi:hypothetical protein